jgi:hypothetical protein
LLVLDGLLPKSLFAWSKTFFDKSKARSRRFENSPFGLKQFKFQIADLPLRQDLFAKNVLMTAQRNFCLGNSPLSTYLKRGETMKWFTKKAVFYYHLMPLHTRVGSDSRRLGRESEGASEDAEHP